MAPQLRWGILSTGQVADRFASAIGETPGAEVVAVASRSLSRARAFAEAHGIPRWYGSYGELATDTAVDVVYVASPAGNHAQHAILCMNRGKHVLCEKPMGLNHREVRETVLVARRTKRFLSEAMWMRFMPPLCELRGEIEAGRLGEIRLVEADFGLGADFDASSRRFNLELGGGALLDVGVYALHLATLFCGRPREVRALGTLGPTGVDHSVSILLSFPGGAVAQLYASLELKTRREARIYGSEAFATISDPFFEPRGYEIHRDGRVHPHVGDPDTAAFRYQAEEVARVIAAGQTESPLMPLDDSVAVMRIADEVRRQIGVCYPAETG